MPGSPVLPSWNTKPRLTLLVGVLVAAIASGALSSSADAAVARVEGSTLVLEAAPGDRVDVVLQYESAPRHPEDPDRTRPPLFSFIDNGAEADGDPVTAGPGCTPGPWMGRNVECPAAGITRIRATLSDGDDALWFATKDIDIPKEVDAGAGNDTVSLGDNAAYQDTGLAVFRGGSGDDQLQYADVVYAGDGNDVIHGPYGRRGTLYGEGGADGFAAATGRCISSNCDDPRSWIWAGAVDAFGGAGNDNFQGSYLDGDRLIGGGGDDKIWDHGGTGNRLDGGAGADTLTPCAPPRCGPQVAPTKPGSDTLTGGGGNDVIAARDGVRDKVVCGSGRDKLFADQRDRVAADCDLPPCSIEWLLTSGVDRLKGTKLGDTMAGGRGGDRLDGGAGDDCLFGDGGGDDLTGGPGNDRLTGGKGRDKMRGGGGADFIDAADGERDTVDCGSGRDRVKADAADRVSGCERRQITKRR